MLINAGHNNGRVVQVGKYIGGKPGFHHTDLWDVSEWMVYGSWINDRFLGHRYYKMAPESSLLRIDGYDPEEETEQAEALVVS